MDTVITNIGQLVTPVESLLGGGKRSVTLRMTPDATLYIQNGRISEIPSGRTKTQVQTLNAGGGVVLPGLVDPFWVMPSLPLWIHELPGLKFPEKDLLNWSLRLLRLALRAGVTTTEVKCRHDLEFESLTALGHLGKQQHPRVVGTLLASLPEDRSVCSMSSLIGEVIPEIRSRRLATFCDIGWGGHEGFVNEARDVLRAASGAGLRPKLHIQAQPVMIDVRSLALSLDIASVGCASHLSPATVKHLFDSNVFPVYLPALPDGQIGKHLNVRALLDQGVAVAIGSGNGLFDCQLKSMWSVLASAIDRMDMTLAEAIVSCTLHNAIALEMSDDVGSLEPGKSADLVILDLLDFRELESVVAAPPVSMVMVGGEIVHSR